MTKIGLDAQDQLLSVVLQPTISAGDENSISLHIDFSDEWRGYVKSAIFFHSKDERNIYEIILDSNDDCIIPKEVLVKSGMMTIGVRGVNGVKVKTSTLVKYKVREGANVGTATAEDPTPNVYQQLMTYYGDISKRFEETLKKTYKTYDILWENPDTDSDFEGKAVSLTKDKMSMYDEFMVTYKETNSTVQDSLYFYVKHPHEFEGEPITGTSGGYEYYMQCFSTTGTPYTRIVTVRESYIEFDDCRYWNGSKFATNNDSLIPCKIYGVTRKVYTDIDALAASAVEKLFISMTQAEYDALVVAGSVDKNKYYMIVG